MVRYHVRADGSMGICTAKEGNCPFGGEEGTRHFTSKTEAERYSESVIRDAAKNAGGLKSSGMGGGKPPIPPKASASAASDGDSNRTASVTDDPHDGLDPTYDPEEYSAEDAKRLYEDDVKIMRQVEARVITPMWTQDSQGKGIVVPIPSKYRQNLTGVISYVNQGLGVVENEESSDECSEEFSTYFAKPDSYVMTKLDNGDDYASADMSGLIRKVDPDSEEAERILKSGNYLDVADAFSEFEQGVKDEGTTFTENDEDYLYDSIDRNGKFVANRVQTAALEWALKKYPGSSGALVRHEDEIYVLR